MTGNCSTSNEISLYFHIPFCKRKCDYCHFYVLPEKEELKDKLLEGFLLELKLLRHLLENKKIVTLYFGGGTPSLFGPNRLTTLLKLIRQMGDLSPNIEITLEANPENLTQELMQSYAEAGVNRVSLGIQTLDPNLLKILGRLHHPDQAIKAIQTTYLSGIKNISIDLMYDLPNQTIDHWATTLQQIQELPICHLSLYNLTIEPHTVFFKNQKILQPLLPDEETSLVMYEMAIKHLEKMGLKQYEISAFAKNGYESKHNTGYWTGRPFLGLGPSAFSYWEGKRYRNIAHLNRYYQSLQDGQLPIDFEEKLDTEASYRELFVINLRLRHGVDLETFIKQYGLIDPHLENTMNRFITEGFLFMDAGRLVLTKKGILFYDTIAAELI